MESGGQQWFAQEVQPHEGQLKSYLRNSFGAAGDIDDIVQESYLRLWKARAEQPIHYAKAFLFQVARRVALDILRRGRSTPINSVGDLSRLPVMDDRPGVAETVSTKEKIALVVAALDGLPPRCRQVVMLRKLKGLSQKEVASRLGIAEKTVDEQLARGVRRLEEQLRRRGVSGYYEP
ncbi:RNA polymerase sigma factor [Oleiharenicola lentus]|uniref:RNA polymerase sigma factor n=1 Tax=Oleiharenicola lentus TaxID=2508720 RepID=UPI003F67DB4C